MSNEQWTPGPWFARAANEKRSRGCVFAADGDIAIADTWKLQAVDPIANANIIAAAPALYEALKALKSVTEAIDDTTESQPELLMASNALAKARGENYE